MANTAHHLLRWVANRASLRPFCFRSSLRLASQYADTAPAVLCAPPAEAKTADKSVNKVSYSYPLPPFKVFSPVRVLSSLNVFTQALTINSIPTQARITNSPTQAATPNVLSTPVLEPSSLPSSRSVPASLPRTPSLPVSASPDSGVASQVSAGSGLVDVGSCVSQEKLTPSAAVEVEIDGLDVDGATDAAQVPVKTAIKFDQPREKWWKLSAEEKGLSAQELWGFPLPLTTVTRVVRKLGQGGFGAVYLVEFLREDGDWVPMAMK